MAERQYKVFLSYSHEYRADAERLVRALGGRGLFVDLGDLLPLGLPWMPELESRILSSDAVIVLIGPGPKLEGWQLNEIEIALDQQTEELKRERNWPVIPVLLPGAKLTSKFVKRNHALALKSATADVTE